MRFRCCCVRALRTGANASIFASDSRQCAVTARRSISWTFDSRADASTGGTARPGDWAGETRAQANTSSNNAIATGRNMRRYPQELRRLLVVRPDRVVGRELPVLQASELLDRRVVLPRHRLALLVGKPCALHHALRIPIVLCGQRGIAAEPLHEIEQFRHLVSPCASIRHRSPRPQWGAA